MRDQIVVLKGRPEELNLTTARREKERLNEIATERTRRMLEIGLPQNMALHGRDCILSGLQEALTAYRQGDFEGK